MAPERRVAVLLVALLSGASAAAQEDVVRRLNEDLAGARYAEALRASEELTDRALAAEWQSYLYAQAGDLPASLREARAGLELSPEHVGLLTQALNASLSLGLAEGSRALAERLTQAARAAGDPSLLERAEYLGGLAREAARRQELAARSVARSRVVALAGLAGALAALLVLSRRARGDLRDAS